jgi:hypothetical protein
VVAAGCSVPFAPGYAIEKQRVEVTYSKAAPDRVSVRAWYRMKNTGTQPLNEIHFHLPYNQRAENLRVEPAGQPLVVHVNAGQDVDFSTHFNEPWKQRDRKEFVLTYDLKIVNTGLSVGVGNGQFFFLPSGGWYPSLLSPSGTFATGGTPPAKWDLAVNVPQGYVIHASGSPYRHDHTGSHNSGVSSRFEQKTGADFDPFVVAGPYVEQQVRSSSQTVFLWTGQSLTDPRINEIGRRFGEEVAYFNAEFGLKDITKGEVWVIGCPDESAGIACRTVPQGVFVPISFEKFDGPGSFVAPAHGEDTTTAPAFMSVDLQLARTWFTSAVREAPDGPSFPMSGTPDYVALSFTISKNPSKRGDYVHQLIQRLDADPDGAKEILGSTKRIEIGRIRSELFYLALEDRCGAANVHHALARIVHVLRGQTWGVNDLRSAMEAECGADLADFFRQWLIRPGIPNDFRARYAGTTAAKQPNANQ